VIQYHQPVLLQEIIDLFDPKPGKTFLDATLGNGGHTIGLLQRGAFVYGLDQDRQNLSLAIDRITQANLLNRFHPIYGNFKSLSQHYRQHINLPLDGIIFDLGLSSNQQLGQGKGFSFYDEVSLDMRLNNHQNQTAENIINTYPADKLYQIFTKYAQEKYARPIIQKIIRARQKSPITTASALANIIRQYYQDHHLKTHLDPSTKVFLALRIAVNDELTNLKKALSQTLNILSSQSIVAIITFNSTEDRLVKSFIRQNQDHLTLPFKKPIRPSSAEITVNPLSRSANLRSYRIR